MGKEEIISQISYLQVEQERINAMYNPNETHKKAPGQEQYSLLLSVETKQNSRANKSNIDND